MVVYSPYMSYVKPLVLSLFLHLAGCCSDVRFDAVGFCRGMLVFFVYTLLMLSFPFLPMKKMSHVKLQMRSED